MDLFALKDILRQGKPTSADLTQLLQSTFAGIARFTIDGRDDELSAFRESEMAIAGKIHDLTQTAELEREVEHGLELLREYNLCQLKFNQTHASELKAVMRTMTETITYLSESRTRSVHQLQFVERELEQAAQIEDIRLLRSRIVQCLDAVREETVRLQSEAVARSQEVRSQIGRAVTAADPPTHRFGVMDTVTGLPSRQAAERIMIDMLQKGERFAVAAFVVVRLSAINARLGRGAGDDVMLHVANHFAQHLSSETLLYRWSGPALVAVIHFLEEADTVRKIWARTASAKQEISLGAGEKSLFVVIETNMFFETPAREVDHQTFFRRLDKFVAEHDDGYAGTLPGDFNG